MPEPIVPTPKPEEAVVIPPTVVTPPAVETPKTMEEIQKATTPEPVKEPETVGLDKFLEIKKENKQFKKDIQDLQRRIEDGATTTEVSSDINSLSEEYPDVDKKFLTKLASTIRAQVEKDADEKISSRLKPLEQKEKDEKIDAAFSTHFNLAIEKMPEFKDIVNRDVIKTLSLDPKNKNKTFQQIIEDTYGSALTGKRTMDTTTPAGGKDSEELNFDRARSDTAYFKEVMGNPRLKAEYNDIMLKKGF